MALEMIHNDPKIFYKVEGVLYRNSGFKENELIEIHKEFREKSAKQSREKAFGYYSSILEVLLESIGLKYLNKKQAESDLNCFYFSNKRERHLKLAYVKFNNDLDKLITVSFWSTEINPYITKSGIKIYEDEKIIEAFGYESELLKKTIHRNLLIEKNWY